MIIVMRVPTDDIKVYNISLRINPAIIKGGAFKFQSKYHNSEITGDFICVGMNLLQSLKKCPTRVRGNFDVRQCKNLKSLEGCPEFIGRNFDISDSINLKSLKYAPYHVRGEYSVISMP